MNSFVIFTQFNLPAKNMTITEEWLDKRFFIFENITLRSIKSQTDQDFLYLIAINSNTNNELKNKFNSILPDNCKTVLVYPKMMNQNQNNSGAFTSPENKGKDLLRPYLIPNEKGLIYTTHIGSDDALSKNYVERVKEQKSDYGFINFIDGYYLGTKSKQFKRIKDTKHFFLTFVEPLDENFKSVLFTVHNRCHRRAPFLAVEGDPMWIKLVHEYNVCGYKVSKSLRKLETGETLEDLPRNFDINLCNI